jgi:predicted MFS family arabinose efflux permease
MLYRLFVLYRDSFSGLSREIWLLALVTLVNRTGMMVIPFLSVFLSQEKGYSLQGVSWIMGAFGLGSLAGSFLGGKLTDRIGFFPVMFWSLLVSGLLYIGLIWAGSYWTFLAAVFFLSTVADSFRPASMASIAAYSRPVNRTRSISLIRLAINLGFSAGPAIGGLLASTVGYDALFWTDGLTCILAALLFHFFLPRRWESEEEEHPYESGSTAKLPLNLPPHRNPHYLVFLVSTLLTLVVFMQLFVTVPVYFKAHFGLSEFWIGLLLSLNGLIVFTLEMPIIFKLERHPNKLKLVRIGAVLIGFSYLLYLLFPFWAGITIVYMLAISLGEILHLPMASTHALGLSGPRTRGQYMGLFSMSGSVAHLIAPVLGLQVAGRAGYPALWWVVLALSVLGLAGYVALDRRGLVSKAASA